MKARISNLNQCPLCNSTKIGLLKIEKKLRINRCLNCQLGFLDKEERKIQRKLKNDSLYSLKDYKKQLIKLTNRFHNLANVIGKYKSEGNILDIGAGFGLFSSILSSNTKYKITALEPFNTTYYLHNLKVKIIKKNLDDFIKTNNKKYDIILLIDVLEHFEDLAKKIEKVKSLLNKNGIVVIQTPNYLSLMAKICANWSWWMIEDHRFFFSPSSIKYFFNKYKLRILHFSTYEDFYDLKKNLDGNFTQINNNLLRKTLKGAFFSIFFPFYFLFRNLVFGLGFGGLIFAILKK